MLNMFKAIKKTSSNDFLKGISMDLFNKLKNMKILLIDDDEWIRDSLSLFFENEGCNLKALETAKEGLKILKNKNYHIIIADYRLPDMNGLEFFKRIQESHPDSFKILITAYGSKKLLSKAKKMGIHDFIEKPFTSETIESSLSRWIKDSSATSGITEVDPIVKTACAKCAM